MDPLLNFDFNSLLRGSIDYFQREAVPRVLSGDPVYIAIAAVLCVFLVVFLVGLFKVTKWFFSLLRRFFLLLLIIASGYVFVTNFYDKFSLEAIQQAPLMTIVIGGVGGIVLLIALIIAIPSFTGHLKRKKEVTEEPTAPL